MDDDNDIPGRGKSKDAEPSYAGRRARLIEELKREEEEMRSLRTRFEDVTGACAERLRHTVEELESAEEESARECTRYREKSEHKLRQLYDTIAEGIAMIDLDGRFIEFNQAFLNMLGYYEEELRQLSYRDVTPEKWHELNAAILQKVTEEGRVPEFEKELRRKDGSVFPVALRVWSVTDDTGRPVGVWKIVRDMTERRRAEEELKSREASLRALTEAMPQMVWAMENDCRPDYVNKHWTLYTGADLEKTTQVEWKNFIHPDDLPEVFRKWDSARKRGEPEEAEVRFRCKDGSYRWFLSRIAPVKGEDDHVQRWVGTATDIDDRKKGEERSIASHNRLRNLVEVSIEVLRETTVDGIINRVVVAAAELTDSKIAASGHGFAEGRITIGSVSRDADLKPCPADVSFAPDRGGVYLDLLNKSRTIRLNNQELEGHPAWWGLPKAHAALDGLLGARLEGGGGQAIGMIMVSHRREGEYTEEDEMLLSQLALLTSLGLKHISARRGAEERADEIDALRQRLEAIFQNTPAVVYMMDEKNCFLHVNRRFEKLFGVKDEEIRGKCLRELFPEEVALHLEANNRMVQESRTSMEFEEVVPYGAQDRVYASVKTPIIGSSDSPYALVGISYDMTERKKAEEALRESEERFRTLADNIAQFAWMADEKGYIFWFNRRWFEYTGTTLDEMKGWGWQKLHHPEHVERVTEKIEHSFEAGEVWEDTFPLRGKDGEYRWFLSRAIPIRNEQGKVYRWFGTNTDITDRKEMEETIRHQAHHDPLTGLPNRRLFLDIIKLELAQASRHGKKLGVLFLDLDHFKEVNDTLGHEAGDELLKQVSGRIQGCIRRSDSLARIGGDEFNLLLADVSRSEYIADVAGKIVDSFKVPFPVAEHSLHVTTSVGISVYPDDSENLDTLLRYADIAMYHAKESGRNTYRFYDPAINLRTLERMRLENMLRQAIHRGEFILYYQPLVSIGTKRMVCAEALLRWQHPELGLLGPEHFLPLAEETGYVGDIDEWVLRTTCEQLKNWNAAGLPRVCMTINLSAKQFLNPQLVASVSRTLEESALPPECLQMEISETTAMRNIERTGVRLRELAAMGVRISIDDFGTGYSSLSHLIQLPIQKLKIDRSFIRDIAIDPDDRAIIAAVTAMAHNMRIKVIAEGVETEDQLTFLHAAGCDEAQGHYFCAPIPAEEFVKTVTRDA